MQGRLELWAQHAHDVLVETAQVLHLAITDADLARIVQERADEHSEMPARSWLPKVLRIVADRAAAAGEPPLTSLVVRAGDHRVAPDYDATLAQRPADDAERQQLAAEARLECYRRYAASVPEDETPRLAPITSLTTDTRGATGAAAKPVKARAPRAAKVTKPVVEEKAPAICMSCFLELPLSGRCPSCD